MRRHRRKVTNRLKVILTVLCLAVIAAGLWIVVNNKIDSDKNSIQTSNTSAVADSTETIEEPEPEPVADPIPEELTDPE